jgi:hypothetical protein
MPDPHPKAMPKEVRCGNWVNLLDYIENTPNLEGSLSGRTGVEKVLEGLADNPEYLIGGPDNTRSLSLRFRTSEGQKVPNLWILS